MKRSGSRIPSAACGTASRLPCWKGGRQKSVLGSIVCERKRADEIVQRGYKSQHSAECARKRIALARWLTESSRMYPSFFPYPIARAKTSPPPPPPLPPSSQGTKLHTQRTQKCTHCGVRALETERKHTTDGLLTLSSRMSSSSILCAGGPPKRSTYFNP